MAIKNHECYQQEVLNKISTILVGNGKPEDSLLFKQAKTSDDIVDIKSTLKKVESKNDDLLKISSDIKESLAQITGKALGISEAEDKIAASRKTRWQAAAVVIAFVAMITSIIIGFNSLSKKTDYIKSEVDLIKTPSS